jgi:hypothetical protein
MLARTQDSTSADSLLHLTVRAYFEELEGVLLSQVCAMLCDRGRIFPGDVVYKAPDTYTGGHWAYYFPTHRSK